MMRTAVTTTMTQGLRMRIPLPSLFAVRSTTSNGQAGKIVTCGPTTPFISGHLAGVAGGAAAQGEHGAVDLPGRQRRLGQRVGAVGAEAVKQQAQVSPPDVG